MTDITGVSGNLAPKGRRFAAGVIDLIIIPIVLGLVIGYIVEVVFIVTKGERLADGWAKTRVVSA